MPLVMVPSMPVTWGPLVADSPISFMTIYTNPNVDTLKDIDLAKSVNIFDISIWVLTFSCCIAFYTLLRTATLKFSRLYHRDSLWSVVQSCCVQYHIRPRTLFHNFVFLFLNILVFYLIYLYSNDIIAHLAKPITPEVMQTFEDVMKKADSRVFFLKGSTTAALCRDSDEPFIRSVYARAWKYGSESEIERSPVSMVKLLSHKNDKIAFVVQEAMSHFFRAVSCAAMASENTEVTQYMTWFAKDNLFTTGGCIAYNPLIDERVQHVLDKVFRRYTESHMYHLVMNEGTRVILSTIDPCLTEHSWKLRKCVSSSLEVYKPETSALKIENYKTMLLLLVASYVIAALIVVVEIKSERPSKVSPVFRKVRVTDTFGTTAIRRVHVHRRLYEHTMH